jgi:hypothetical protein
MSNTFECPNDFVCDGCRLSQCDLRDEHYPNVLEIIEEISNLKTLQDVRDHRSCNDTTLDEVGPIDSSEIQYLWDEKTVLLFIKKED